MNLPNKLTMLRIILIPVFLVLVLVVRPTGLLGKKISEKV